MNIRSAYNRVVLAVISSLAVHAAEVPASVNDALSVVGSARRAVAQLPVLAGTESFDLAAFRAMLIESRGATPYERYVTGQGLVEIANGAGTTAAQLTSFSVGWAALEVNWVYATLLGDEEAAKRLLQESNTLVNHQGLYMENVQRGAAFVNFYPRIEANSLAMSLRRTAAEMNLISLIPNTIDPEGFVRQRMQVVFNRLVNAAEFIRSAGEAFTLYY